MTTPTWMQRVPSRIGRPLLALLVRSFSTTSRPALRAAACGGRPRAGSDATVARDEHHQHTSRSRWLQGSLNFNSLTVLPSSTAGTRLLEAAASVLDAPAIRGTVGLRTSERNTVTLAIAM